MEPPAATNQQAETTRAPSYFSHFFSEQLHNNGGRAGDVKTLYIDRDPDTFREVALHLQGYHITPKDGEQFVKLFADAQFYSRKSSQYANARGHANKISTASYQTAL